jgi:hypothetical protein
MSKLVTQEIKDEYNNLVEKVEKLKTHVNDLDNYVNTMNEPTVSSETIVSQTEIPLDTTKHGLLLNDKDTNEETNKKIETIIEKDNKNEIEQIAKDEIINANELQNVANEIISNTNKEVKNDETEPKLNAWNILYELLNQITKIKNTEYRETFQYKHGRDLYNFFGDLIYGKESRVFINLYNEEMKNLETNEYYKKIIENKTIRNNEDVFFLETLTFLKEYYDVRVGISKYVIQNRGGRKTKKQRKQKKQRKSKRKQRKSHRIK